MNKHVLRSLCLTLFIAGSIAVGSNMTLLAQEEQEAEAKTTEKKSDKPVNITHSFPGVTTFSLASGRVGFFEQGTGKIYVYDDNLSECVFTGQLNKLGEPIEAK